MNLVDFDSSLWETHRGAYGNVKDDVIILTKEKQLFYKKNEDSDYRIAFDNLFESLSHQMSFYKASYIVMPYIVKLMEQYENDFLEQIYIISRVGFCIATDIPENHPKDEMIEPDILESYNESISIIQQKTIKFLTERLSTLKQMPPVETSEFCTSILAILGNRYAAYILTLSSWDTFYILCNNCNYCNEELSYSFSNKKELAQITPVSFEAGKWDKSSFEDTFVWLSDIFYKLGQERSVKILSYFYGTYTCPRCGHTKRVIDFMKNYFFEETM